jgi:hypothetical protein
MQVLWCYAFQKYKNKKMGKQVLADIHQTWCCIRTQSLFISVKFCSTNSTASITVSSALEKKKTTLNSNWKQIKNHHVKLSIHSFLKYFNVNDNKKLTKLYH